MKKKNWWDKLATDELFSALKMERAASTTWVSYSSETVLSVLTHISIYYRRGDWIAKPDHFKRRTHTKVNLVIMAY